MFYAETAASPLGRLTLACTGDGQALAGLWLEGQRYYMAGLPEAPVWDGGPAVFRRAERWLEAYFAGQRPDPKSLPLAPTGSGFRQAVWERLLAIPYGATVIYGDLARDLGSSPRAVGGAVGHNPISIIIPCHRVLGADGALTGYAGGLEAKKFLLRLEGVL